MGAGDRLCGVVGSYHSLVRGTVDTSVLGLSTVTSMNFKLGELDGKFL